MFTTFFLVIWTEGAHIRGGKRKQKFNGNFVYYHHVTFISLGRRRRGSYVRSWRSIWCALCDVLRKKIHQLRVFHHEAYSGLKHLSFPTLKKLINQKKSLRKPQSFQLFQCETLISQDIERVTHSVSFPTSAISFCLITFRLAFERIMSFVRNSLVVAHQHHHRSHEIFHILKSPFTSERKILCAPKITNNR